LELLYKEIPEYHEKSNKYFDVDPFIQAGLFGKFLREKIDEGTHDEGFYKRAYGFLNKMVEFGDESIEDILSTEIFIGMYTYDERYLLYSKQYLSMKAHRLMKENINLWKRGNNQ